MNTNDSKQKANFKIAPAITLVFIALMCILTIQLTSALVDVYSPANNTYTNQSINTFEYLLSGFNATTCDLLIDLNIAQTTISPIDGFNQLNSTIISGPHTWKVNCTNGTDSQESQTRTITLDTTPPSVVLFTPNNGAMFTTSNITISFVTLDALSIEMSCNIKIDGLDAYSTIATSAQAMTMGLAGITDGNHNWSVTCQDFANNSATSEQRTFIKNSTQTTQPFEFSLSNKNIIAGQGGSFTVNGPSGTSVRVEACPDVNGFVECNVPLNLQNYTTYPVTASLPFTNTEKKYVIEAHFTIGNRSETKIERYNVTSDLSIAIEAPTKPRKNEPIKLEANVAGGIGNLNSTWYLSNGSVFNIKKINITYPAPGNYTNLFIVKDQFNNTENKSITIEVSDSRNIRFATRDIETQAIVKYASISIDSQTKDSDVNGEVQMFIRSGERDITVLAQNYTAYIGKINITQDATITLLLTKLGTIKEVPQIEPVYPADAENIEGPTSEISFRVNHKSQTNCSIYINDRDDGFFINLGNVIVSANNNELQRMGVVDLEDTKYWWKVECKDSTGQIGSSVARTFTVGKEASITNNQDGMTKYSDMAKEFDTLIASIESIQPELKETLQLLGIKQDLEQRTRIIKNGVRDIDSLQYKNLDPASYEAEKAKIDTTVTNAYIGAPESFELIDSDGYVDYIENSELEELLNEYALAKNTTTINKKKLLEKIIELQQEAVISTKTRSVSVKYKDGTQKELTIVIKQVKTFNITDGTLLIENIPKSIVASAKQIKSEIEFETIKDDPIIGFDLKKESPSKNEITIAYYFEKKIDLENLRDINTAVLLKNLTTEKGKSSNFNIIELLTGLTGFTIKSKNYAIPNWNLALVGIIIIAGLFSTINSRIGGKENGLGVHSIKYLAYLTKKGDTTHYIKVILSDIKDNLEAGYIEKAISLYSEAQTAYNELPAIAKNDVYEQVIECANLIAQTQNITNNNAPLQMLISKIEYAEKILMESQLTDAINIYKEVEQDYHRLDEKSKEAAHTRVVDLVNKINVIAESNKSRYNQ